jgi:hypothetical protein
MRVLTRITLFILGLGLSLIVPTGVALAAPVDVTTRQETFQIVDNFCNSTQFVLEGTFTAVSKDNGDGTSTVIAQVQASGTIDGTEYVFNQTRKSVFVGGSTEIKGDAVGVLVSQGSATNYVATFHFDLTVDPIVFDLDVKCVG